MTATSGLDALRGRPFELLRELERRSRAALAGGSVENLDAREWVGIGFRLGADRFVVNRSQVREIMMVPATVTRVPGAKPWILGLANLRGQLLTIVDFKQFLGAGIGKGLRSARVLVLNSADYPVGLLADELFGFRRFLETEFVNSQPDTLARCERYLDGCYRRGAEEWPIFNLQSLLANPDFQRASEH